MFLLFFQYVGLLGCLLLFISTACNEECVAILHLVNEERYHVGLEPVCINSKLMRAAHHHSDFQSRIAKMTHTGQGGSNIGDRVSSMGYVYERVGENVAFGQFSAQRVMNGWMNSPGHRKNILTPKYIHMGIAVTIKSNEPYWTQVFASPQRGMEKCDFFTALPILESSVQIPLQECNTNCQTIVSSINDIRSQRGKSPLCLNSKLMVIAQELALSETKNLPTYILEGLFVEYDYALNTFSWFSFLWQGKKPRANKINSFYQQNSDSLIGKFDHFGIGELDNGDYGQWLVLFASTYDDSIDKCDENDAFFQYEPPSYVAPIPSKMCDAQCAIIVSSINDLRSQDHLPPLCLNSKLMIIAQELISTQGDEISINAIEFMLAQINYEIYTFSYIILTWYGRRSTMKQLYNTMHQNRQLLSGEFDHIGIGEINSGNSGMWLALIASTYDYSVDLCDVSFV